MLNHPALLAWRQMPVLVLRRGLLAAGACAALLAATLQPKAQSLFSPAPIGAAPRAPAAAPPAAAPADPAAVAPAAEAAKPRRVIVKKRAPPPVPRETALSVDPTPTLLPETFFATAKASERYAAIMDAGGWPRVPPGVRRGSKGKDVLALRQRLSIEGDLAAAEAQNPDMTRG